MEQASAGTLHQISRGVKGATVHMDRHFGIGPMILLGVTGQGLYFYRLTEQVQEARFCLSRPRHDEPFSSITLFISEKNTYRGRHKNKICQSQNFPFASGCWHHGRKSRPRSTVTISHHHREPSPWVPHEQPGFPSTHGGESQCG